MAEDTAKRDACRRARLLRMTARLTVLADLLKSTIDSMADGVNAAGLVVTPSGVSPANEESAEALTTSPGNAASAGAPPDDASDLPTDRCGVCGHPRGSHRRDGVCLGSDSCPCTHFRWFGPIGPTPAVCKTRRTITRGTVFGTLDRLDDALERNEAIAAAAASRDLRAIVDDLPL